MMDFFNTIDFPKENITLIAYFGLMFIGCILILLCVFMIVSSVVGYFMYIYFKKKIFNYQITHYNKQTQQIIQKFGDCNINRVFLIKKPIDYFYVYIMYLVYQVDISYYNHVSLVLELELPNNNDNNNKNKNNKTKKWIRLEKNEGIYLYEDFCILNCHEVVYLKKPKLSMSLTQLLDKTKDTIGERKFYNWHVLENNCQHFTKEILNTLHLSHKKIKREICQHNHFEIKDTHFMYCFFDIFVQLFSFVYYF